MKTRKLIRRALALCCALILTLSLVPAACADASKIPDQPGFWRVWNPYSEALNSGDTEQIIRTGDAVLAFFNKHPLDVNIAELELYMYVKRLDLLYYENRGDYAAAIDNTRKLLDRVDYMHRNSSLNFDDLKTRGTAHLDVLSPFAGVYAASYTQRSSYSSKIAPSSGALYGSVHQGYLAGDGSGQGSIASVYVELGDETAAQYDYLIRPILSGGQVLQLNLNYPGMGVTARAVPSGAYDANLNTTLSYLGSLGRPVLLRIGGEMNIWSDATNPSVDYVSPADFIQSYRYIADKARTLCPNAELVWSPADLTRWGEAYDLFWPGDAYVDWVGMSFYFNYDDPNTQLPWLEHAHVRQFADPLICAKGIVSFARKHNKPVAATEGGAFKNGSQGEAYAVSLTAKEFAAVPMVYPEIKSIIHFDMNLLGHDYTMTGALRDKTVAAIATNPSLISRGETVAATYVPLEQFNESVSAQGGKIVLGAAGYTYNDRNMTVRYTLDGAAVACSGPSNQLILDTNTLPTGPHTLKVTFTDVKGYTVTRSYRVDIYANGTVKCSAGEAGPRTAKEARQVILLDGREVELPAYAIEETANSATNYVRVRDLAAVMNGTAGQYNVHWDNVLQSIDLQAKTAYSEQNSTELNVPFSGGQSYSNNTSAVLVNGQPAPMQSFVITYGNGGHTYFQLRALGKALGFNVRWDPSLGRVCIDSDRPYTG